MSEHDQRALYTAFAMMGLLMRGTPIAAIPDATKRLVEEMLKDE